MDVAELEWKIDKILEVVEDNGDTFAQRAQMYYQKRPELIEMLSDLRKSYRVLADKVVAIIRSESIIPTTTSSSFCCSGTTCNNNNYYRNHHYSDHLLIFDDPHHPQHDDDYNNTNKNIYPAAEKKVISNVDQQDSYNCDGEKGGGGGGWDELLAQVTELMDENTSKQAELMRRYTKKNEDMKLLVKENRRLREILSHNTQIDDANKQQTTSSSHSRWKPRHFFRKLLP